MSNRQSPRLADFELLAIRSDSFVDARRIGDQEHFLLRKVVPEGGVTEESREQFQRASVRASAFCGSGMLEVVAAFEDEGAFYFALPFFEGRALTVHFERRRKFRIAEAWEIALGVARTLSKQRGPHGAITAANVLLDEKKEMRLAPAIALGANEAEPTLASDMRQVALLVCHLVFGTSPSPSANARALTAWTMKPEITGAYRPILTRMLAANGPVIYKRWDDCCRDMQQVGSYVAMPKKKAESSGLLAWAAVIAAVAGGAWYWNHSQSQPAQQTAIATKSPEALVAPIPTAPKVADEAKPEEPKQDPAAAAEAAALIDYTRLIAGAMKSAAGRDYAGAVASVQAWLDGHQEHSYREAAQRQLARLQLAQTAYDSLTHGGKELAGATLEFSDKTEGTVATVENGKLDVAFPTQFGSILKKVEIGSLPDAAVSVLMSRIDTKTSGNSSATFLLAGAHFSDARALLKATNSSDANLLNWADEWEKSARDAEALAGLDRVSALINSHDVAGAVSELEHVKTAYADSPIVTTAMAQDIYRWEQQLAAEKPPIVVAPVAAASPAQNNGYPGLPVLTLSSAVPIGDPDFKKLTATTQWVIEHGNWQEHRAALDQALIAAAARGNWTQYAGNLQKILTQKTASVILSQDTALHAMDPSVISNMSKDKDTTDFLNWLFTNPRAIQRLAETLKPQDRPQRVLEIWRDCWKVDREGAEKYMSLALAVAVDFDDPIPITPGFFGMKGQEYTGEAETKTASNVDPVGRYQFYRDADTHGMLKVALSDLEPYELAWVVDAPVPTSELTWAQKNVHYSRKDWGKAYFSIRYRMDKAAGGVQIYDFYTLAEIKERGGICGDQAYFAAMTAKANGIPAMVVSGQGDRGGHAWVQWESTRNGWSEAGRYADNYAAGTTSEPQTHRTVKEQELHELTAPQRRSDAWDMTERYLKLSTLLANAKQPELSRIALEAAVQTTPQDETAWNRLLDSLEAAKVTTEDWERQIARMRVAFQKFPDIVQSINKRETDYLAKNGDAKAALAAVERQGDRFIRKDKSRTDLILDSVYKEVELAEKAGETEKIGKIYRDALREKGKEVVAFKSLAPRYYDWAKGQKQGVQAVHEIDQTFERNFKPTGDYFALGAYHDTLAIVIDLYKKEGLAADVHRLERISEKVDDKRQDIGDQSKKNARNN